MANRPIAYTLTERKATLGKMAGKTVLQARPTGRKRVDHRNFCEEVARATNVHWCGGGSRTATRCLNSEKTCEERRYCRVW